MANSNPTAQKLTQLVQSSPEGTKFTYAQLAAMGSPAAPPDWTSDHDFCVNEDGMLLSTDPNGEQDMAWSNDYGWLPLDDGDDFGDDVSDLM